MLSWGYFGMYAMQFPGVKGSARTHTEDWGGVEGSLKKNEQRPRCFVRGEKLLV